MAAYEVVKNNDAPFRFAVIDENGSVLARVRVREDADEIVAALSLVEEAVSRFPGLIDGETPVSGADLVDLFDELLRVRKDGRFSLRR